MVPRCSLSSSTSDSACIMWCMGGGEGASCLAHGARCVNCKLGSHCTRPGAQGLLQSPTQKTTEALACIILASGLRPAAFAPPHKAGLCNAYPQKDSSACLHHFGQRLALHAAQHQALPPTADVHHTGRLHKRLAIDLQGVGCLQGRLKRLLNGFGKRANNVKRPPLLACMRASCSRYLQVATCLHGQAGCCHY